MLPGGSSSSNKTYELMVAVKFSGLLLHHRILEKITQQPLFFPPNLSSMINKLLKLGKYEIRGRIELLQVVGKVFHLSMFSYSWKYGTHEKHYTLADTYIFLQTTFAKVTNKVYTRRTYFWTQICSVHLRYIVSHFCHSFNI